MRRDFLCRERPIRPEVRLNPDRLLSTVFALELLDEKDTAKQRDFVLVVFERFLHLVELPFYGAQFDFGSTEYMDSLYAFGMEVGQMSEAQKSGGKGSRHAGGRTIGVPGAARAPDFGR